MKLAFETEYQPSVTEWDTPGLPTDVPSDLY